jgi:hypothetical protein
MPPSPKEQGRPGQEIFAGMRLIHKLLPGNGFRNALETAVL